MITVVIPTYNEEKNIEKCLTAIAEQSIPRDTIEIIVVDGESSDRTRDIASKIADKVIIQNSEGVGGARNDGFKIATGDIVATTDADIIPYPRWLETIMNGFSNENIVAVTGFLDPYDWGTINGLERLVYKFLFWLSNQILKIWSLFGIYHLCGANSAFRKDTFLKAGGYLPLAYADDTELFKRIKPKGKIRLLKGMNVHYSVRRIKKMGLIRYILFVFKMEWEVSILGLKPLKGNYAKQTYE